MGDETLIERMQDVYDRADPFDHNVLVSRDVILGWSNEIGLMIKHMKWLNSRLINVYGENPNVDWAHKTRRLIGEEK